ncbi:MAG: NAD(P)-dependent alcohol dehydrogenase [Myxococcales bacterium]|nr:NAD(P)-dependent alcohol dehydrogenase [Myxococcales bacterium]
MRALGVRARPRVGHFVNDLTELRVPLPEPAPDEVRVRVHASAINVDDVHIVEGTFAGGAPLGPKPTPDAPAVPGSDFAGTVDAVGSEVHGLAVGQRVYGMSDTFAGRGPWAEFVVTAASRVHPIPEDVDFEEAAALPVAGTTALCAIEAAGEVRGLRCLVVGASGGVGSLAVQALCGLGAEVWAVCSGRNAELVRSLGAAEVLDYTARGIGDQLEARGVPIDRAFDFVGGRDVERQCYRVLRPGGAFVTVVGPVRYVGDHRLGWSGLARMFGYIGWRMAWTRLPGQARYHFAAISEPRFEQLDALLLRRGKRAPVDQVVPLTLQGVREATAHVLSHRARGKVIIRVA